MWRGAVMARHRLQGRRLVISVHNQQDPERWAQTDFHRRLGCRLLLRSKLVWWVAVNEAIQCQLIRRGAAPARVRVISPYIPPGPEAMTGGELPAALRAFLASRSPVLSVYGCRYDMDRGVDLYGFDLAIEAVGRLRSEFPSVGLVLVVPNPLPADYHERLTARVDAMGCGPHVLFVTRGLEDASRLWAGSRLYLRPTTTDGDSLAVHEALDLGVPVIASDAAPRPPGCLLFRSRDLDSFVAGIRHGLAGGTAASAGRPGSGASALLPYTSLYREVLGLPPGPCDR